MLNAEHRTSIFQPPWPCAACRAAVVTVCLLLNCVVLAEAPESTPPRKVVTVDAVFHAENAHWLERRAATDVARALKTGKKWLPIRKAPEHGRVKNAIVIGKAAIKLGLVSKEDLEWCGREGFVINCRDETIVVAGPTPVASLYGVQTFNERQASLRSELGIKGAPPRVVSDSRRERPFFDIRRLAPAPEYQYRFHGAPNPRDGANPELFEDSDLWYDHTAGYLVPRKMYFKDHPEYFALRKGKRTAERDIGVHLCLSNPAVTLVSIERMDAWMRKQPEYRFFPVSSGDWSKFCQCAECHKLDPPRVPDVYYDMCTRELLWVNAVARPMAERHPDKIILCFAYAATRRPPPVVRPEKNVWLSLAIWRNKYPYFFDHVMDQKPKLLVEGEGVKLLDQWLKIVPDRVCLFVYPVNAYEPALLENTASRIRFLAKKGIRGISFRYGHPARTDFFDLFYHVYSRLLWNPDTDVYGEAGKFLSRRYGAGGEHLMRYFELVRARYRETSANKTPLDANLYPKDWYSEAFTTEAVTAFDAAAEANADVPGLRHAVRLKKYHFLHHVLRHLPRDEAGKVDRKRVMALLTELSELAVQMNAVKGFAGLASAKPDSLEKLVPGCSKMVIDWVKEWHKKWMKETLKAPEPGTDDGLLDEFEE